MSYAQLAEAVDVARRHPVITPPQRRSLATITDQHIAWQESGASPERALSLPALFAVVRLIASNIDQLPIDGAPEWLARPRRWGAELDQGDLIQHTVTAMALQGRAFWLVKRVGDSWRVDAVHNGSVGVQPSSFGRVGLSFTYNGEQVQRVPAFAEEWAAGGEYLLHIPYLVTPGSPAGTSPVAESWQAIEGYLAVERQAATLLDGGGGYNGGILTTEQMIDRDTAEAMQDRWAENRRSGKIPVLGAGLTYEGAGAVTPRDATWIESRLANAQVVASMYGVPPDMLGMTMAGGGSSLSYSNSRDNNARFRANCLEAFTSQIAAAIGQLLPQGRSAAEAAAVRFDYTDWEGAANASPDTEA